MSAQTSRVAAALVRRWYSDRRPPLLLRPLEGLYRVLVALRRALYRRDWLSSERLPVPVLVIGNISVGGTGKTPLTIALVEYLRQRGWQPGVVSRGHGGSNTLPRLLDAADTPRQVGDEPCIIRARTGVPVAVGHDRPAAARLLVEAGVDVVLADDGLQHYRLQRDLEICVLDGVRRFGNRAMLPAGPLREPMSRLKTIPWRVCNGGLAGNAEVLMRLCGDQAANLADPSRSLPLSEFAGRNVHAVAGIGYPQRFFDSLRAQFIHPVKHAFADHHAYRPEDLDFADDLPVLMTAKDAIKCAAFARDHWWSVPIDAILPELFLQEVDTRLQALRC